MSHCYFYAPGYSQDAPVAVLKELKLEDGFFTTLSNTSHEDLQDAMDWPGDREFVATDGSGNVMTTPYHTTMWDRVGIGVYAYELLDKLEEVEVTPTIENAVYLLKKLCEAAIIHDKDAFIFIF
jgi:hypothetical protein